MLTLLTITLRSLLFVSVLFCSFVHAASQTIDFHVNTKQVHFNGTTAQALAVNDQIPGPTLHFKEGDEVTINVHNDLDEGTTIHWHGLLVPWKMDGVEGVNQEGIPPGEVFSYKFKLKQSGTYWYHSHAGLQEQRGIYGGIIIDPLTPPPYKYNQDHVIVLSDWTNTKANQVYENLKKTGDFYTPDFPLQPSLARFMKDYDKAPPEERQKLVDAYAMMQNSRMSVYDISDVAYDAFLLNGHTACKPWTAPIQVGDIVRLRFIGAGASTIFKVKIPNTTMQVVHIQGHDVSPYEVNDFTIAPGETTDVLVKIEKDSPYMIYAESSDSLGAAYGALVTSPNQPIDFKSICPFPAPKPIMGGMHEYSGNSDSLTHGTKYQNLRSATITNDPNKPYQEIKIKLSGYMEQYIWFINDVPEYDAEPILIEPGKRYRLVFTNESMMHHPMHLHGHFYILRNGHGEYDPFLHTIEVPPGATAVADFDADASGGGQWYFHCHHLYHMVAGMARVFRYSNFMEEYHAKEGMNPCPPPEPPCIKHPQGHGAERHWASFIDLGYDPYHNIQKGNLNILTGWNNHKLQLYSEDAEIRKGKVESADLDIFYWYPISEFWSIKGGANYFYKPSHRPYWQPGVGIEGLFPYFIYTNLRTYLHKGSVKFDLQLERDTQLAHNFYVKAGLRGVMATGNVKKDEITQGLNYIEYIVRPYYTISPNVALFFEFDYTQDYGKLKKLIHSKGQSASEKVFMGGISLII